jgi:transcription elongation factor GreB
VFFGARVTVEDEDGATHAYEIVGPDEFDAAAGRISMDAPLARALLGRRVGDAASVVRPKGRAHVEIVAIEYPPDEP